ncbi:WAT1-related protein At5g64700-like [Malus sylvestris]|uniref:WAT1-related protein At5g64700-like n=1 Tax=Malus sylvestris TaxID=3752 RepID=UPI0021AC0B88|nr:WAT1-related protein At5g64700-like [Malus sylvestris]XP_050151869.1 WAT1-related protein At5g64700-like [Malus sylvestris]
MAVLLGMKKLKIRSTRGQAKVAGTIFCIGGSLILTFWKGGYMLKGVEKPLINVHNAEEYGKIKHVQKNWIKGFALILISYIAWSEWLILQKFKLMETGVEPAAFNHRLRRKRFLPYIISSIQRQTVKNNRTIYLLL